MRTVQNVQVTQVIKICTKYPSSFQVKFTQFICAISTPYNARGTGCVRRCLSRKLHQSSLTRITRLCFVSWGHSASNVQIWQRMPSSDCTCGRVPLCYFSALSIRVVHKHRPTPMWAPTVTHFRCSFSVWQVPILRIKFAPILSLVKWRMHMNIKG